MSYPLGTKTIKTGKLGQHATCTRCSQDIEWTGRATGWRDRGNNRECPPYFGKDGEIVVPKGKRHTTRRTRA